MQEVTLFETELEAVEELGKLGKRLWDERHNHLRISIDGVVYGGEWVPNRFTSDQLKGMLHGDSKPTFYEVVTQDRTNEVRRLMDRLTSIDTKGLSLYGEDGHSLEGWCDEVARRVGEEIDHLKTANTAYEAEIQRLTELLADQQLRESWLTVVAQLGVQVGHSLTLKRDLAEWAVARGLAKATPGGPHCVVVLKRYDR